MHKTNMKFSPACLAAWLLINMLSCNNEEDVYLFGSIIMWSVILACNVKLTTPKTTKQAIKQKTKQQQKKKRKIANKQKINSDIVTVY